MQSFKLMGQRSILTMNAAIPTATAAAAAALMKMKLSAIKKIFTKIVATAAATVAAVDICASILLIIVVGVKRIALIVNWIRLKLTANCSLRTIIIIIMS